MKSFQQLAKAYFSVDAEIQKEHCLDPWQALESLRGIQQSNSFLSTAEARSDISKETKSPRTNAPGFWSRMMQFLTDIEDARGTYAERLEKRVSDLEAEVARLRAGSTASPGDMSC